MTMKGITAGAFDMLHPGHLLFFKECKRHCDHLTIMLHANPGIERPLKNAPLETTLERFIRLDACKYVDAVIPYDTEADLFNALCSMGFDIRFLGADYAGRSDYTGHSLPIHTVFIDRKHGWSSTSLRERMK